MKRRTPDTQENEPVLEVGRTYTLTFYEGHPKEGPTTIWNCRVLEVRFPVVHFDHGGHTLVLNLSSPAFISAKPDE